MRCGCNFLVSARDARRVANSSYNAWVRSFRGCALLFVVFIFFGALELVPDTPLFAGLTPKKASVVIVVPSPTSKIIGSSLDALPLGYFSAWIGNGGVGFMASLFAFIHL